MGAQKSHSAFGLRGREMLRLARKLDRYALWVRTHARAKHHRAQLVAQQCKGGTPLKDVLSAAKRQEQLDVVARSKAQLKEWRTLQSFEEANMEKPELHCKVQYQPWIGIVTRVLLKRFTHTMLGLLKKKLKSKTLKQQLGAGQVVLHFEKEASCAHCAAAAKPTESWMHVGHMLFSPYHATVMFLQKVVDTTGLQEGLKDRLVLQASRFQTQAPYTKECSIIR
eukprot:2508399-Amphidinium_carterae.2